MSVMASSSIPSSIRKKHGQVSHGPNKEVLQTFAKVWYIEKSKESTPQLLGSPIIIQ